MPLIVESPDVAVFEREDFERAWQGTGMPAAGWRMMIVLHVTHLRVWVTRE